MKKDKKKYLRRQKRCYKKGRLKNRKRSSKKREMYDDLIESGDTNELWKDEYLYRYYR
jgi:hypothetical protein